MQHPDEGVIHTWLDGELPAGEASALEAHVAECAECAAAVAEARGLIAAASRIVSSLDIVPGDVIPATKLRRRAWYASTQLRAAAAVLVVAGASLVVMRRERASEVEHQVDRIVSSPAVVDMAEPQFQMPGAKSGTARRTAPPEATAPAIAAPTQSKEATRASARPGTTNQAMAVPGQRLQARDQSRALAMTPIAADTSKAMMPVEEKALQRKVIDAPASVSVGSPAPVASDTQRSLMSRLGASGRLEEVVVTGVAATTAGEAALREVKSDTTGNIVVTVYDVSPGVQVTLTEIAPQAVAPERREADQMKEAKSEIAQGNVTIVPAAPAVANRAARIETVSWSNLSTGRTYTLSGPLTKERLTVLRKRLPPAKR